MAAATIYDVSRHAGVSIATVSRVLNSPDQVGPETRARVLNAIDELNFVPKFEAQARARKGIGRIGVLTPFFTSDSFIDRLRGVVAALAGQAYEPVIYDVASAAQRDGYLANLPLTRRVDGIVVIGLPFGGETAKRLQKFRMPTVQIVSTGQMFNQSVSSIVHDDTAGGRMAAEYLLERGYRRFGFVGDTDIPDFVGVLEDQKLGAFRQALALAGIELPDSYARLAPFGMEHARQEGRALLDLPEPPEVIFAGSDTQAIGVIGAARERGLAVPGDLAVMGFDDIHISDFIGLTTIHQQLRESGRLAVELLLAQITEEGMSAQQIDLQFTLMQRATA